MIRAFALRLSASQGVLHLWSGRGKTSIEGEVYESSKGIHRIEHIPRREGTDPDSIVVELNVRIDKEIRDFYKDATGRTHGILYALDEAKAVVYHYAGLAKDPVSDGQLIRLTLTNEFHDLIITRPEERINDVTQKLLGGDKSFERAAEIKQRAQGLSWRSYL